MNDLILHLLYLVLSNCIFLVKCSDLYGDYNSFEKLLLDLEIRCPQFIYVFLKKSIYNLYVLHLFHEDTGVDESWEPLFNCDG